MRAEIKSSGMQIFQTVETIEDFRSLDEAEILCGYLDGLQGLECPLSEKTRAFWHGWRNGLVDGGWIEPDAAHSRLEREFLKLRPPM